MLFNVEENSTPSCAAQTIIQEEHFLARESALAKERSEIGPLTQESRKGDVMSGSGGGVSVPDTLAARVRL